MPNVLTGLIPTIYTALDTIPRELIAGVSAVQRDSTADAAALNAVVRSPVVPAMNMVDVVPAVTNTLGQTYTIGMVDCSITKSKAVPFVWNGEESLSAGSNFNVILQNQFAQAFRTIANAMEADVVSGIASAASRAIGTAGTTPFGTSTSMSDFAGAKQVLDDNGAPPGERSMILGTAAAASIGGNQTILLKANEAGSSALLRGGDLGRVLNMDVGATGQIGAGAAAGTGAGYLVNGAHAVGATSVVLETGTGTVLAGDVVTIGTSKYVVQAGVAAPGTITIAAPGLRAPAADGATVTVNASSVKNVFLQKAGFLLATRVPAMPQGGDAAADMTIVTDPVSGLSFSVAVYKQYKQNTIEVAAAWGVKALRPEFCGVLMG